MINEPSQVVENRANNYIDGHPRHDYLVTNWRRVPAFGNAGQHYLQECSCMTSAPLETLEMFADSLKLEPLFQQDRTTERTARQLANIYRKTFLTPWPPKSPDLSVLDSFCSDALNRKCRRIRD